MSDLARTRSNVDMRSSAAHNSAVASALGADIAVEILEDRGDWFKIRPNKLRGAADGYAPRLALVFPPLKEPPVFPLVPDEMGSETAALVPGSVAASQLVGWLAAGGRPEWLAEQAWNRLDATGQQTAVESVRQAIAGRQAAWDGWVAELNANNRLEAATVAEWLAILAGGSDVWSIRSERIYKLPSLTGGYLGWVGVDDILHWTGHVRREAARLWHQVELYKLGRNLQGWYRSELLDEYTFPTPETDTNIAANAGGVFDLAAPLLRAPSDPQIAETLAQGATAAQYIDIQAVIGRKKKHHNLCGEFCVAALAGGDVIPQLLRWKAAYPRAKTILENNQGTTLNDLQSLLELHGLRGSMFQYSSSAAPASPLRVKRMLQEDKRAIAGVVINSRGKLDPRGTIQHWVVIVDTLAVGTGGWIRLYNPFKNQEEIYTFDLFLQALRPFGIGLWISR